MSVIRELTSSKTVILISHRLFNVVNSDMIYVLNDGELVESGQHDTLLQNKNYYAEPWDVQQSLENMKGVS